MKDLMSTKVFRDEAVIQRHEFGLGPRVRECESTARSPVPKFRVSIGVECVIALTAFLSLSFARQTPTLRSVHQRTVGPSSLARSAAPPPPRQGEGGGGGEGGATLTVSVTTSTPPLPFPHTYGSPPPSPTPLPPPPLIAGP